MSQPGQTLQPVVTPLCTLTLQITEVRSDQEWTTTPDMIAFSLDCRVLSLAEKCVKFMHENDIATMQTWRGCEYTLYCRCEEGVEGDCVGKVSLNGADYCEFTPEYELHGCHLEFWKDGGVQVILPFKYTGDKLWCTLGNLSDLVAKLPR